MLASSKLFFTIGSIFLHACDIVQVREVTQRNRCSPYIANSMPCHNNKVDRLSWYHVCRGLRCHSPAEDIKDVFTGNFNEGMNQLLQWTFTETVYRWM